MRNTFPYRHLSNSIFNGVTFYRARVHDRKGRLGFAASPGFYTDEQGNVTVFVRSIILRTIGGNINDIDRLSRKLSKKENLLKMLTKENDETEQQTDSEMAG